MTIRIPTIDQCLDLIDEYRMLENIRAHSFKVARVAELLVDGLIEKQYPAKTLPDRDLVISGALLHDIAKTRCLKSGGQHAAEGAQICILHGYPALAEIVLEHVILEQFEEPRYKEGFFVPKEIVYYADKRVRHDQVVSLSERLDYILERYGENDPTRHRLIKMNFDQTKRLEYYLFNQLPFSPSELTEMISSELFVHSNCVLDRTGDT